MEFIIKTENAILPDYADPVPALIGVRDGSITEVRVGRALDGLPGVVTDVGDSVVMPGLVDSHAHINEPGRTEWEGFQTATRAAAAGGITTVIDMPLNSIPATTTLDALKIKQNSARGACAIDYGFWGGLVPGNLNEIPSLIEAGVMGFKCFLVDSGVPEFEKVSESDLRKAMPILARAGIPLIVHAELEIPNPGKSSDSASELGSDSQYSRYLASRPPAWEIQAIRMMIALAQETNCQVHIVHLSAAGALKDLENAQSQGVRISAETCPHYLSISSEEINDGATHFKCAPPIREKQNQDLLWEGLKSGIIDFIVSDHSPCIPSLKCLDSGDFGKAWGGIAGIQFSLPIVWTEMKKRNLSLQQLSKWMSERTASFIGLGSNKGRIQKGFDADLVVWNPEDSLVVEKANVLHRHSLTPYEGRNLFGRVLSTYVRGVEVFRSREESLEKKFPQTSFGKLYLRQKKPNTLSHECVERVVPSSSSLH